MKRVLAAAALLLIAATPSERQRAEHALARLGFGARPGDVERVMRIGVDRWIDAQLHPERIADAAVEARVARYDGRIAPERDRRKIRTAIANAAAQRILRAAESERQLHEVMTDFWMNHFNVFAGKRLSAFLIAGYENDAIRPHIWGRFEDLLLATAKSPAMLVYLDQVGGCRLAVGGGTGALPPTANCQPPTENYARELMELHTLGVDGGYTQKDVTELARVFTGWSIERPGTFVFRRRAHDSGAKTVLGVRLSGGGMDEGERMIRFLARHPSTARHIATKLCARLVADEPPPALVDRVARRFLATSGDLRATVKAIIDSPEFWSSRGAKVKSPFEYAISAVRAAGATIDDPIPLARELRKMGEGLYLAQPPTGYADDAETWSSSGVTLARLDFALALANDKMPGVRVRASDADALARTLGGKEFSRQ